MDDKSVLKGMKKALIVQKLQSRRNLSVDNQENLSFRNSEQPDLSESVVYCKRIEYYEIRDHTHILIY